MKKIYLIMMAMRGSNDWKPVYGWDTKKSAIESIKSSIKMNKELKLTAWKYRIKEIHLFLDSEIPY